MNVNDLTFGIEIECQIPTDQFNRLGLRPNWSRPNQFPGLPAGWVVKSDSSLRRMAYHEPIEIVSPVLRGADGVQQIREVYAKLNELGVTTNRSCGLHIHVGVPSRTDSSRLQKLICLVTQHERGLYASTGSKSREVGNWSKPINNAYRRIAKSSGSVVDLAMAGERYQSLNITNLTGSSKPTVEFRLFAPTMNITKVLGHLATATGLVIHAYTTKGSPAYKRNKPMQTGSDAVARLIRVLGWSPKNGGKGIEGSGITAQECRAIRKEFKRLAEKYDADTTATAVVD